MLLGLYRYLRLNMDCLIESKFLEAMALVLLRLWPLKKLFCMVLDALAFWFLVGIVYWESVCSNLIIFLVIDYAFVDLTRE